MVGSQLGVVGSGAQFQSLDDFVKEQDELQAEINRECLNAHSQSGSPATKKTRNTPDVASVLLEDQALKGMGDTNWVGRLQEYHQVKAIYPPPKYTEIQVSLSRFSCSVTIKEKPEPITSTVTFGRKKEAKGFVSKLAIDWLVSQNLMPSNGAVKFPKVPVAPQTPQPKKIRTSTSPSTTSPASITTTPRERSTSPTSYPGLIPDLCHALGFNIPTYKIALMVEGIPIYHGYADFGSDPRILGKVGEFRDIYGKKKAKEVCAKEVWSFLKDTERQRLEGIEDSGIEKKRTKKETPQEQGMNGDGDGDVGIVSGI
ncbi:hypothetical protein SBOR_1981 [Sclerotinia borealis F-4128]|uniref:DRBM domain-containing protein n=1 Tax=Sclerotinia borealis (strain F-4128) TaxID=1432307 RepID=W9CLF5_SCLBF|nr:hypothetical protein SBOR_1981 [Sclerotinia borealis F-4128]